MGNIQPILDELLVGYSHSYSLLLPICIMIHCKAGLYVLLTAKQYGLIGLVSIISVWLPSSAFLGAFIITIIVAPPVFLVVSLFCMTLKYFKRASNSHTD